jgi:hypothetical protein
VHRRLDIAAIQEPPGQVDQIVVEADAQAKSQPFLGRDDPEAFAEHTPNLVRQQQAGELTPDLCAFRERRVNRQAIFVHGELAELHSSRMAHSRVGVECAITCRYGPSRHARREKYH